MLKVPRIMLMLCERCIVEIFHQISFKIPRKPRLFFSQTYGIQIVILILICGTAKIHIWSSPLRNFLQQYLSKLRLKERLIIFLAPLLEVISNVEYKKWEELKMREKTEQVSN